MFRRISRSAKQRRDRKRFDAGFKSWLPTPMTKLQVAAAVSHWPETVVIAAAGSGKTTLLLGRCKYLVESQRASEQRILLLAFNKLAADEMGSRAQAAGLNLSARTFHSFGNAVLNAPGRLGGVAFGDEDELHRFISAHIDGLLRAGDEQLTGFFTKLLVPFKEHEQFATMSDFAAYHRALPRTLSEHRVKSHGELIIANYLFARGADFDYEAIYKGGQRGNWHRPDFTVQRTGSQPVYIEYWGVDGQGRTAPYVDQLAYARDMGLKRQTHASNSTVLIELTYQDLKDGVLVERLESELARHGVRPQWRSPAELARASEASGYTTRFVRLCQSFLAHSRSRRLTSADLGSMRASDPRDAAFLRIFAPLLLSMALTYFTHPREQNCEQKSAEPYCPRAVISG